MTPQFRLLLAVILVAAIVCLPESAFAGMASLLPSDWTAERGPVETKVVPASYHWQVQTLSFFLVTFLVGTKAVQAIWNAARRDFTFLPRLSYARALSLTLLWGTLFVVVLAMISGARELMTPGAWRKQGWTYQLDEQRPATTRDEAVPK